MKRLSWSQKLLVLYGIFSFFSCRPTDEKPKESVMLWPEIVSSKLDTTNKKARFLISVTGTTGAKFDAAIAPNKKVENCEDKMLERQHKALTVPIKFELTASYESQPDQENRLICLFAKAKDGSDLLEGSSTMMSGRFAPLELTRRSPDGILESEENPPSSNENRASFNEYSTTTAELATTDEIPLEAGPANPEFCEVIPRKDIESKYDLSNNVQVIYQLKKNTRYPLAYMKDFKSAGKSVGVEVTRDSKDDRSAVHSLVVLKIDVRDVIIDCGNRNDNEINQNRVLITDIDVDLFKGFPGSNSTPQCVLKAGIHKPFGGIATAPNLAKKIHWRNCYYN